MAIGKLTSEHFKVVGRNKKSLALLFNGNTVVLFHGGQRCQPSQVMMNALEALVPERMVNFAVLYVQNELELIRKSRGTTTPITATPTLIFYAEGQPREMYSITATNMKPQHIRSFIQNCVKKHPIRHMPPPSQSFSHPMMNQSRQQQQFVPTMTDAIRHNQNNPRQKRAIFNQDSYSIWDQDSESPEFDQPEGSIPYNARWEADH